MRAPFQILVFPFRRREGRLELAIFRRADDGSWQGIAGGDLLELPEHAFAIDCSDIDLKLSNEHTAFEWVDVERAEVLLRWDSNKAAVRELHQRLIQGLLPLPV
jgi:dihydroneopterin triphosphate diphosphatase